MKTLVMAASLAAMMGAAVPALAQYAPPPPGDRGYDRHDGYDRRDGYDRAAGDPRARCDLERSRYARDRCLAQRQDARDWRQYRNYDYNRPEPGARGYYAERYYRNDPSYRDYRLGRNDRVYRGGDGRYYCRHSDGTTGLILGGATGALFGNAIAPGGSKVLGALIGGGTGALLGQSIDRGQVNCR